MEPKPKPARRKRASTSEAARTFEAEPLASINASQPRSAEPAIAHLLEPDDPLFLQSGTVSLSEYASVLKDQKTSIDEAVAWLRERHCVVTNTGVTKHRKQFSTVLQEARQAAFVSASLVAAASDAGPTEVAEACTVLVEQHLLQAVYSQLAEPDADKLNHKAWRELLGCVNLLLGNRLKVETLAHKCRSRPKGQDRDAAATLTTRQIAERIHSVLIEPEKLLAAVPGSPRAIGFATQPGYTLVMTR